MTAGAAVAGTMGCVDRDRGRFAARTEDDVCSRFSFSLLDRARIKLDRLRGFHPPSLFLQEGHRGLRIGRIHLRVHLLLEDVRLLLPTTLGQTAVRLPHELDRAQRRPLVVLLQRAAVEEPLDRAPAKVLGRAGLVGASWALE